MNAKCPLCGMLMDPDKYSNHMAWEHPDFEVGWFPPIEILEKIKKEPNENETERTNK